MSIIVKAIVTEIILEGEPSQVLLVPTETWFVFLRILGQNPETIFVLLVVGCWYCCL